MGAELIKQIIRVGIIYVVVIVIICPKMILPLI